LQGSRLRGITVLAFDGKYDPLAPLLGPRSY
jgi:hypothetical protein